MDVNSADICVVGAGPRGICVVERLVANAPALRHAGGVVHVVDPYAGLGGRVWRTTQSPYLLMNTIASQVTVFTDSSVECEGPIVPGPTLYEWAKRLPGARLAGDYPEGVREEAARLGPDSYPTRGFYGHYLIWALRYLTASAGSLLEIRTHTARAVRLDDAPDGSQVVTLDDGSRLEGLCAVVLAQGHIDMEEGDRELALAGFAAAHGLRYQPPASPSEVDLSGIAPGEPVVLRGLGLSFFDHLALLTAGRGGVFERRDGRLVYVPSGREPMVYAGSRRGLPYHARGENEKGVAGRHQPRVLSAGTISALRARAEGGAPLSFSQHVWPLIAREAESVYYATLVARRDRGAAEEFVREYLAAGPDGEGKVRAEFGIAVEEEWDWGSVAEPHGGRRFAGPEAFRDWLLAYLRFDLAEARIGNVSSPLKAATDVLRDIRNEVRQIIDHSGLDGDSYRQELEGWYTPLNAYLSIGPPAGRVEEMVALIEAGVVRPLGPGMWVRQDPDGTGFLAGSAGVEDFVVRATALIEARLPGVDVRRSADPLVRHLMATGQIRAYRIPGSADPYETGGLEVTQRPYRIVRADGRPHLRRFAYGVPTEAVYWATAASARPGVDSVVLSDADAIARVALCPVPDSPGGRSAE